MPRALRLLSRLSIVISCVAGLSGARAEAQTTKGDAPAGMVWIAGGTFAMGAASAESAQRDGLADALPAHAVQVYGFWIDRTVVTNDEFARFIHDTGYVTTAEQTATLAGATTPAGSLVFVATKQSAAATPLSWWQFLPECNWRHPDGPNSTVEGKGRYPVVHVSYFDAQAYAAWCGKRLPTEAEWEFAARGGLKGKTYAWGNEPAIATHYMANTWQGDFPVTDAGKDGFRGIAPVAQFPPNAYGLYDMAGNVWQWCADWYRSDYYTTLSRGSVADNPQGPVDSSDAAEPGVAKRVQRGGSYLCSDRYCHGYLVASRGRAAPDTSACHVGFRCAVSLPDRMAAAR